MSENDSYVQKFEYNEHYISHFQTKKEMKHSI